jgi:hypothetical protein
MGCWIELWFFNLSCIHNSAETVSVHRYNIYVLQTCLLFMMSEHWLLRDTPSIEKYFKFPVGVRSLNASCFCALLLLSCSMNYIALLIPASAASELPTNKFRHSKQSKVKFCRPNSDELKAEVFCEAISCSLMVPWRWMGSFLANAVYWPSYA